MVISLWFLMGLMGIGDIPTPFDIFDFLAGGWTLAQALIAFSGMQEKSLKRMENALTMMKIYFLLTAIISLREGFEAQIESEGRNFEVLAGWIEKVLLTTLIFFPTRKIRNTLKSIPKGEELAYKDALKGLNSLPFTIYKYWLLIFCLVLAKWFILFIYGDFLTLKRFPSNHPEFVSATMRIVLNPLRMAFSFNAFEGLRRKSLNKMEASIKIMKVCIAIELVLYIWRVSTLYGEGRLTIEENEGKWFILLRFLFRQLMIGFGYYLLFLYGAFKTRNILKVDREAKRVLDSNWLGALINKDYHLK